jgi:hypothetical protein
MPNFTVLPPPPRQLRRHRGYGKILAHTVALVLVLCFGQLFVRIVAGTLHFIWWAEVVPAHVTKVFTRPGNRGPNYYLDVTFRVGGADHTATVAASPQDAERQEGDPVEVVVLAEQPDHAQLYYAHFPRTFVTLFMLPLGIAPFALVGKLLWDLFIAPWRLRRLLRGGELASAVIVNKAQRRGRSPRYTLIYEFSAAAPAEGAQATDALVSVPGKMQVYAEDYLECQVGDRVDVIYDPDRPHRNVIYRYADYQFVADPAAARL